MEHKHSNLHLASPAYWEGKECVNRGKAILHLMKAEQEDQGNKAEGEHQGNKEEYVKELKRKYKIPLGKYSLHIRTCNIHQEKHMEVTKREEVRR